MKGKNNKRVRSSRSFYKKHKSRIVNDFLELVARELKEVEDKMVKEVLKKGTGQRRSILFGFIELQVRPDRGGGIIVERKINDKDLKKAILEKVREIKEKKWTRVISLAFSFIQLFWFQFFRLLLCLLFLQ